MAYTKATQALVDQLESINVTIRDGQGYFLDTQTFKVTDQKSLLTLLFELLKKLKKDVSEIEHGKFNDEHSKLNDELIQSIDVIVNFYDDQMCSLFRRVSLMSRLVSNPDAEIKGMTEMIQKVLVCANKVIDGLRDVGFFDILGQLEIFHKLMAFLLQEHASKFKSEYLDFMKIYSQAGLMQHAQAKRAVLATLNEGGGIQKESSKEATDEGDQVPYLNDSWGTIEEHLQRRQSSTFTGAKS